MTYINRDCVADREAARIANDRALGIVRFDDRAIEVAENAESIAHVSRPATQSESSMFSEEFVEIYGGPPVFLIGSR